MPPRRRHDAAVDSRGAVDEMFNGSFDDRPNTVDIEYVSEVDAVKHHPLVRATRHIDLQLKNLSERVCHAKGRWHDMQMQRLKAGPPFVVVFRKGVDWKAYCDDRCVRSATMPGSFCARTIAPSGVSPGKSSSKTSTCVFPRNITKPHQTLSSLKAHCVRACFGAERLRLYSLASELCHRFLPFLAKACARAFF